MSQKISLLFKYYNAIAKWHYMYTLKSVMLVVSGLQNSYEMQGILQSQ